MNSKLFLTGVFSLLIVSEYGWAQGGRPIRAPHSVARPASRPTLPVRRDIHVPSRGVATRSPAVEYSPVQLSEKKRELSRSFRELATAHACTKIQKEAYKEFKQKAPYVSLAEKPCPQKNGAKQQDLPISPIHRYTFKDWLGRFFPKLLTAEDGTKADDVSVGQISETLGKLNENRYPADAPQQDEAEFCEMTEGVVKELAPIFDKMLANPTVTDKNAEDLFSALTEVTFTLDKKSVNQALRHLIEASPHQKKHGINPEVSSKILENYDILSRNLSLAKVAKILVQIGFDDKDTPHSYHTTPVYEEFKNENDRGAGVYYIPPEKLDQYEIKFKDGIAYDWRGNKINTENRQVDFVMAKDGKLFIAPISSDKKDLGDRLSEIDYSNFKHSSFLHGQPVAAAGTFVIENGEIVVLTNLSGHYRPAEQYLEQVSLELLRERAKIPESLVFTNKQIERSKFEGGNIDQFNYGQLIDYHRKGRRPKPKVDMERD
jgi:hypothetical protein